MPYAAMWKKNGIIHLLVTYDEAFITDLKIAIPKAYRRWNLDDKAWEIHELYEPETIKIVERHFILKKMETNNYYEMLLKHLTAKGLKTIWRQVAKNLHPDTGGNHMAFVEARQGYEALCDRCHTGV